MIYFIKNVNCSFGIRIVVHESVDFRIIELEVVEEDDSLLSELMIMQKYI